MYRDIPDDLRALIEPVVSDHGLELVDLHLARGRGPWRLRVTVDTAAGDGLVSVERCAQLSRELSTHLDAAADVPSGYHLEVSSPGLDRVLAREKDFEAACGGDVRVETRAPLGGRRRFRGRLLAFEAGLLTLLVDGSEVEIPFAEVARARRVYEFTRADFARADAAATRRSNGRSRSAAARREASRTERA